MTKEFQDATRVQNPKQLKIALAMIALLGELWEDILENGPEPGFIGGFGGDEPWMGDFQELIETLLENGKDYKVKADRLKDLHEQARALEEKLSWVQDQISELS